MYDKNDFLVAGDFGEKIVFKYNDNIYIINKEEGKYYLYNESENTYKYYTSFHELINSKLFGNLCLIDILNTIIIVSIETDIKKEFISAIKANREIEFDYNGVNYFKSCSDKGYYIYNSKDNSFQYFETPEELLEKGKLEGRYLNELWDKINIQFIY